MLSSHLGSLRCAGCVDRAGFHTVGFVSATQSEATFPPPLVAAGQRAVTPEHTGWEAPVIQRLTLLDNKA